MFSPRTKALRNLEQLYTFSAPRGATWTVGAAQRKVNNATDGALPQLIKYAGIMVFPAVIGAVAIGLGALFAIAGTLFLPWWLAPLLFIGGAVIPFSYLDKKAQTRALDFSIDFPTVLLATASTLSAGHTALVAIERSVKLLPEDNKVRTEVSIFLDKLRRGVPKELAISEFADGIRLPELSLFRSAFLLSLENGGRFSPTLERLAQVLKDRSTLIKSARTATAIMRMTANTLLFLSPIIVSLVAFRTANFFELVKNHPVANSFASIGLSLIVFNYWILRRMSDFRP